jgi:hypothetical protein
MLKEYTAEFVEKLTCGGSFAPETDLSPYFLGGDDCPAAGVRDNLKDGFDIHIEDIQINASLPCI